MSDRVAPTIQGHHDSMSALARETQQYAPPVRGAGQLDNQCTLQIIGDRDA
jgi:hypothetical protein